ncbi:MAG: hypothetical protein QOH21_3679 [Acidobacteriota bacterium]|jgi:hypothetical protein|nr:hypothetical protein [Acidobacteriota bacterium]
MTTGGVPHRKRFSANFVGRAMGLCLAFWLAGPVVSAVPRVVRRALVIGIQDYLRPVELPAGKKRPRRGWSDLDGPVNDAESIAEVLRKRYLFDEVETLLDAQATRANILARVRARLVTPVSPGDVSVLYFAGHGSQMRNSASTEDDHRDETIVPYDSIEGAMDIRDKEIRRLLNDMLDRKAVVTAMFDSCHAGSISRGWPLAKERYALPDPRDAAELPPFDPGPVPESRGAVVVTAALDTQAAVETTGDDGLPHGVFTTALLRSMRNLPVNTTPADLLRSVRVSLESSMRAQLPTISGTIQRQNAPLFGGGVADSGVRVAVARGRQAGIIDVHGGVALGLAPGTELRSAKSGGGSVRLKIVEVEGLTRSRAVVTAGDPATIDAGTLFEVDQWTFSGVPLRVWWAADAPPLAALTDLAAHLPDALAARGVRVIGDPTEEAPEAVLRWWTGTWQLVASGSGAVTDLGTTLDGEALARLVGSRALFLSIPPPRELGAALRLGAGELSGVTRVTDVASADYILQGRITDGRIAYAWTVPNRIKSELDAVAMPLRTAWQSIPTDEGLAPAMRIRIAATSLEDHAVALNRVRMWRELQSPPGAPRLPYCFALQNTDTGTFVDRGTIRGGESYVPVVMSSGDQPAAAVEPQWVYVFGIMADGKGRLIYPPRGEGAIENRVPAAGAAAYADVVPLGGPIDIGGPYGIDTYYLLTSADRIDDPDEVFNFEGIRSGKPEPANPLAALLKKAVGSRSDARGEVPTTWTIERLSIRSSEP